jgi:uncharacterized protein YukE
MGKTFFVDTGVIGETSTKFKNHSEMYTQIYTNLIQQAQTMGTAWESEDNLAFVNQISGLCDDLKSMSDKLISASEVLKQMQINYENRLNDNTAQVKKLSN